MDLFKTNRKKRSKGPSSPPPFTISGPVEITESTYFYPTSSISPPPGESDRFSHVSTNSQIPPPPPPKTSSWSHPGAAASSSASAVSTSATAAGAPMAERATFSGAMPGSHSGAPAGGPVHTRRASKTNSTSTVSSHTSAAPSPMYHAGPRQSADQVSLMSNSSSYTIYSEANAGLSERAPSGRVSAGPGARNVPNFITQAIDLASDSEVHAMFEELIDSMGIPESKRNYMRTIPIDSKRTMLRAKQQQAKKDGDGIQSQANPTYFIDKISGVDLRYVPVQVFTGLRVSISTHPISWIREFIDEKGLIMLAECLGKLNHRPHRREQDLDQELEIMRALKTILNLSWGATEVLAYPRCVSNICHSLDSPHLLIRKLAAELLTFLCYSDIPRGHAMVLQGMETFQRFRSMDHRFEPWLTTLERTIDGRGRMGSMVGASQEIRQAGMLENDLVHYGLCNVLLMNAIIEVCDEVEVRVHLRQELQRCGIHRIQEKLLEFGHEHIQHQIDKYEREAEHDNNEVMEFHHYQTLQDMGDPHELFEALLTSLEGRSQEAFLSILQHLLLIREDAETRGRYMQLIDHLIAQVVLDRRGGADADFTSTFGVPVATLAAKFSDEEQLVEALSELRETKEQLEQVRRGKNELELEVSMKADGLVQALKSKIMTLEDLLRMSRHTIMALQNQIKELREQFQGKLVTQDTQLKQMVKSLQSQTEEQAAFHANHDQLVLENRALREGDVLDPVDGADGAGRRWVVNPQKLQSEVQRLSQASGANLRTNTRDTISRYSNLFAGTSMGGTVGQLGPLGSLDEVANAARGTLSRNKMAAAKAKLEQLFEDAGDEAHRQTRRIDDVLEPTAENGPSSSAGNTPMTLAAQLANRQAGSSGRSSPAPSMASPPAPSPPMMSMARRKEIRYVPKVKLKNLQWDKLDDGKVASSVWQRLEGGVEGLSPDEIEEMMHTKGILGRIEGLFTARAAAIDLSKRTVGGGRRGAPAGTTGEGDEEGGPREPVSVLDPKRAHNVNLMLGRLKQYTFPDLRRAILRCDNEILTENVLKQLLTYIPTASERGLLSAYTDDPASLASADAFFVEMMKINRYEQRLHALLFWTTFEERFGYLRTDVTALLRACEALPNSEHFPQVLETILVMGNFMNGAGFRGGAFGFKINSLNKLVDTKATDNKTTLLHFLAETLEATLPASIQFLQEFKGVEDACRVSSNELRKDFNEMKTKLSELGTELEVCRRRLNRAQEEAKTAAPEDGAATDTEAGTAVSGSEDRFLLVMTSFHDIARDRFTGIEQMYADMQGRYKEVAQLYGEDAGRMPPEEFFGIFRTFSSSFEKALKDNTAEAERRQANEKRRQRILERDTKRKEQQKEKERRIQQQLQKQQQQQLQQSSSRGETGTGGEAEKGVMDNLLQSLITGNDFDTLARRKKRDMMSRRRSEVRRSLRRTSLGTKAWEMLQKIKETEGSEGEGSADGGSTAATDSSVNTSIGGFVPRRSASRRSGMHTNPTLAATVAAYPPSPLGKIDRRPSDQALNGQPAGSEAEGGGSSSSNLARVAAENRMQGSGNLQ
ncbi:hypothetical protein IWQ60_006918 [Tieghemiomyces parasiticus]|uniref:Uncharacterized protein n=1 Tax=Tieghemiomyces parasiticus TaxID=78921 RepID=A0A9W8A6U7_9FUNG|nr:hypothetical protein IWQ60_006918 [Tieghemiomyces parasiticus]